MALLAKFYLKHFQEGLWFAATISLLAGGSAFAWTSPTLPILMDPSLERPITKDEASWIVSLLLLASCISPLPGAFMVNRWGRKATLLVNAIPSVIAWIIVMMNTTPAWLYVSRLLLGWNYGIIYSVTPIYLGEIASKEVRGSVGILITVMAKSGILLTYCVGPYVSILNHAIVLILIPITFVLTFWWCPESPYYLILKQEEDEAKRSLKRLRGREDVNQELQGIIDAVKLEQENPGKFTELFRTKGNRRGVITMMSLVCSMQLCGSQAVLAYSQQIFKETESILDAKISTIFLGIIQLVLSIIALMIVDKVGRRILLIISTTGVAAMTAVIGLYFFMKEYLAWNMSNVSWLPVILIVVYIGFYNIGLSTVTFMMIGELFPTNIKAIAASSTQVAMALITFGVTKLYQVVSDGLGTFAAFWSFFICTIIGLVFVIIYVPETKGKTLAEIQIDINATNQQRE